jgi:hypothetical protein
LCLCDWQHEKDSDGVAGSGLILQRCQDLTQYPDGVAASGVRFCSVARIWRQIPTALRDLTPDSAGPPESGARSRRRCMIWRAPNSEGVAGSGGIWRQIPQGRQNLAPDPEGVAGSSGARFCTVAGIWRKILPTLPNLTPDPATPPGSGSRF